MNYKTVPNSANYMNSFIRSLKGTRVRNKIKGWLYNLQLLYLFQERSTKNYQENSMLPKITITINTSPSNFKNPMRSTNSHTSKPSWMNRTNMNRDKKLKTGYVSKKCGGNGMDSVEWSVLAGINWKNMKIYTRKVLLNLN